MSQLPVLAQKQQQLVKAIDDSLPKLKEVAPPSVDIAKFKRLAMAYVYNNPSLADCDQTSLRAALFECATYGLYPSSVLNEAYLVPFKGKVKMIPHWIGLLKLAKRGSLRDLRAYIVYKQDEFSIEYGFNESLVHRPNFDHDFKDEDITGCYVVKEHRDCEKTFHYLPIRKIMRIRDQYSRDWQNNGKDSAWGRSFAGMVIKTTVKAALKNEDLSEDLSMLIDRDNAIEQGKELVEEPQAQLPIEYLTGRTEQVETPIPSDVEGRIVDAEVPEDYKPEPPKPEKKPEAKPKPEKKPKSEPKPEPERPAYEATDEDCPI